MSFFNHFGLTPPFSYHFSMDLYIFLFENDFLIRKTGFRHGFGHFWPLEEAAKVDISKVEACVVGKCARQSSNW